MSIESLLARHFVYTDADSDDHPQRRRRPVILISITGIALGVTLVLLAFFITAGFKREVSSKVDMLLGNVKISNPDNSFDHYTLPLTISDELLQEMQQVVRRLDSEARVYTFADQMGLIRGDSIYKGVSFHGVSDGFSADLYSQYLVSGSVPDYSVEPQALMISQRIATQCGLQVGEPVMAYFATDESVRVRKFVVTAIIDTGFPEYDDLLCIGGVEMIQGINGWSSNEVGGIQVHNSSHHYTQPTYELLYGYLSERNGLYGERYAMSSSEQLNPTIFGWLNLLDSNVYLILCLMVAVAGLTMITGIVVLVMEKVPAIATLKALGYCNHGLRRTFARIAQGILLRGLLWGNAIALLIALLQKYSKLIQLDPSQYYTSYVPIHIDLLTLLGVNVGITLLIMLLVLIPTTLIAQVKPAEALRFE